MLKNIIKTLIIALILIIVIGTYNSSLAAPASRPEVEIMDGGGSGGTSMSDVSENPNSWGPTGNTVDPMLDNLIAIIATVVNNIGTLVSIISLLLIGIKFMLGSVEERAQYKQTMKPWLIGAILLFGMSKVPTILYDMSKELFK